MYIKVTGFEAKRRLFLWLERPEPFQMCLDILGVQASGSDIGYDGGQGRSVI